MNNIETGRYVEYKKEGWLVVGRTDGNCLKINRPQGDMKQVKVSSVIPLKPKATKVVYREAEYLVTGKGNIFSLTTGKMMKWGPEAGTRKAILSLAAKAKQAQ